MMPAMTTKRATGLFFRKILPQISVCEGGQTQDRARKTGIANVLEEVPASSQNPPP